MTFHGTGSTLQASHDQNQRGSSHRDLPCSLFNTTFQRRLYLASLPNTTSPRTPTVRPTRPLLLPLPNPTLFCPGKRT
ncbi:hypothetical protein FQN60_013773, partial [Etheostoma spectabile]